MTKLQKIGKILHFSNRGNLIARSDKQTKVGAIAMTKNFEKIGLIFDVFGPKEMPYVAIKPAEGFSRAQLERFVGKDIYLLPKPKQK